MSLCVNSNDQEEYEDLQELIEFIKESSPQTHLQKIRDAYYVARCAHSGQIRASGAPYLMHPVAVTKILAELGMDEPTLIAGLLHDVIEDCPGACAAKLEKNFGPEVFQLIEGVTKLKAQPFSAESKGTKGFVESRRAAENLRKMLLAMAKDVRVMIIKLADRLHNIRTLESLSPERKTRIASETLDIYAPLAGRLGIWQLKWELEDLSFKNLHPKEFNEISNLVSKSRIEREQELQETIIELRKRLMDKGIDLIDIHGRPKHLYSIFNKIVKSGFEFDQILDLLAIRIILENPSDCYVALGIVHDLWIPIPGFFYDYIAKPKSNGYQSLHTKVVGPHGEPVEIQIRTKNMHQVAEYGVAAHWLYKEGKNKIDRDVVKLALLRQQLFDWSSDSKSSSDFLSSVSTDLFSEQVFVFTPKGDVVDLPVDSTPIDFAFRIHSDIGFMVVGSKINGVLAPLSTRLQNGDIVELLTRSNAQPSLDWLDFVRSVHAKSKIQGYFRKQRWEENIVRGKEALEKEMRLKGFDPHLYLNEKKLSKALRELKNCKSISDLYGMIGEGLVSVQNVISKIEGCSRKKSTQQVIQVSRSLEGKMNLVTQDFKNVLVHRAKCCDPIPGEDLVGYIPKTRGMILHRKVCPNIVNIMTEEPDRVVVLQWPPDGTVYPIVTKIITVNRQSILMEMITALSENQANVSAARIRTLRNQTVETYLTIEVSSFDSLMKIFLKISQISGVITIIRMFGKIRTS